MTKLPKIKHPIFEDKIPSTGQKVSFRPFTVKEEKILLVSKESGQISDIYRGIIQVLGNCILSPANLDLEALALYDINYLIIKLYAKSTKNIIELKYVEEEPNEETGRKKQIEYSGHVNLDNIKVTKSENTVAKKFGLKHDNDISLVLKYPNAAMTLSLTEKTMSSTDVAFKIITNAIESVVAKGSDEVVTFSEIEEADQREFIDNLSSEDISHIHEFYKTMPTIRETVILKTKDGKEITRELVKLSDFFTF